MALSPSEMLCFSLYTAAHAMQQAYRPLLDHLGVTYPQYLVLSTLWSSGTPDTVGGIGKKLQLDSSTLTPLLKRLESAGLVTRSRCSEDERQVRVDLSAKGRDMQARAAHIPKCIFEKTGLDATSFERLQAEIFDLAEHLREDPGAGPRSRKT